MLSKPSSTVIVALRPENLCFDTTTGVITYLNACLTILPGYNSRWVYASQAALVADSGSGAGLYISEGLLTGGDSYIALLRIDPKTGCAKELPNSPCVDANGSYLQSITAFSH